MALMSFWCLADALVTNFSSGAHYTVKSDQINEQVVFSASSRNPNMMLTSWTSFGRAPQKGNQSDSETQPLVRLATHSNTKVILSKLSGFYLFFLHLSIPLSAHISVNSRRNRNVLVFIWSGGRKKKTKTNNKKTTQVVELH